MDAEQFLQVHALKAMTGALAATVLDLSPEALVQALAIGERGLARTTGVEVRQIVDGAEPLFEVTYHDGPRSLPLRTMLRERDGEWTIARLERLPSRDRRIVSPVSP